MEEQVLVHISKLFPLLHSTFQSIHFTFKTLDVNCYEHQNVLKRWILPVKEESYECTCQPSFDEPEEMNRCSWHHAVSEPVIKLCLHYLLVFADTLPQKKTELNGIRLKELEEELNLLIRSYKILDANTHLSDDVLPLKKSEIITSENSAGKGHWALTGIWNRKCWNMFAGFKNMLKISYNGKEECMSLHKKIQDIQNLQLQIEILKFLKNVFPVLSDLQNDNVALVNLYKSCFALCNISCVPVPVLLKT